jgi:hypothetical protein
MSCICRELAHEHIVWHGNEHVAAQSKGEPATQLSSRLQVRLGDGRMYDGPIGVLVDALIDEDSSHVIDLGGGSIALDPTEDLYVVGVSTDEKTSWRRILQVSRHPANGGMVCVHTRSGKTTCAPLSHSFLCRSERGVVPVLGSDLKVGMHVPVARVVPPVLEPLSDVELGDDEKLALTRDVGWLCGAHLADSCIYPAGNSISAERYVAHPKLAAFMLRHFGEGSYKCVPAWAYAANHDFIAGLLCGYFDGDGSVNALRGKQVIQSSSISEKLCEDVVLLLARLGIFASMGVEKGSTKPVRSPMHTVQISHKYACAFRKRVGPMVVLEKARALDEIVAYAERDDVEEIPKLGPVLWAAGRSVLPAQSRTFGRYLKKDVISRQTLARLVAELEAALAAEYALLDVDRRRRTDGIAALERARVRADAAEARGRQPMVPLQEQQLGPLLARLASELSGGVIQGATMSKWAHTDRIGAGTLARYLGELGARATHAVEIRRAQLDDVRDDKLPALRSALNADVVWDEIVALEHLPDPGEPVYNLMVPGNDSFMVDCGVLVHNTVPPHGHARRLG